MLAEKNTLEVKLVDFGFAEIINEKELISKAGTPGYIPPEVFKMYPYLEKGDVFSIGVIFYSVKKIKLFKTKANFGINLLQRQELLNDIGGK